MGMRVGRIAMNPNELEVALAKNCDMVREVAGDHEGQRAHGEGVAAGYALAHPGVGGDVAKKRNAGETHSAEFLDMRSPGNAVGAGASYGYILVETRQRRIESPRKPHCAKRKQTFRVAHMTERLADAPLFLRVAVQGLLLGNSREEFQRFVHLVFDLHDGIFAL